MPTRGRTPHYPSTRSAILAAMVIALAFALPATASAASQTLTVEKAGAGTGTVASSPAGINCGPTCSAPFNEGATVSLIASTGANTLPMVWSGCDSVNGEGKCIVAMSGPRTVKATFNLIQVGLTVTKVGTGTGTVTSSPEGIQCGATCSASFGKGTTVTLTGISGAGTEAVKWTGCDSVTGEDRCVVAMSSTKAIAATFNLRLQLTVTKAGLGTGTVTSSPAGIECGSACSAKFDQGTTVVLTSVSGPNTEAAQWSGCDAVTIGNKCEVKMSAARAVTATYKPKAGVPVYTVTVERTGTGSGTVTSAPSGIDCGGACSIEVLAKATLTLTATPAPGSAFDHWSGGGCTGTATTCEKQVTSTRTVKAVFTAVGVRTLAISLAGTGTGTVTSKAAGISCSASCSPQIAAGKKVTLSAKAAGGSTFSGFSGACTGTKACKVQLSEAQSVTATFAKVPTPHSTATATVANKAKVKGGKALVGIRCGGPASCRGSLKLFARLKGKGKKATAIGSATFSLAPGSSTTLKVTLSAKAKQALKATGKLKARVSGEGIGPHALSLKLASR